MSRHPLSGVKFAKYVTLKNYLGGFSSVDLDVETVRRIVDFYTLHIVVFGIVIVSGENIADAGQGVFPEMLETVPA